MGQNRGVGDHVGPFPREHAACCRSVPEVLMTVGQALDHPRGLQVCEHGVVVRGSAGREDTDHLHLEREAARDIEGAGGRGEHVAAHRNAQLLCRPRADDAFPEHCHEATVGQTQAAETHVLSGGADDPVAARDEPHVQRYAHRQPGLVDADNLSIGHYGDGMTLEIQGAQREIDGASPGADEQRCHRGARCQSLGPLLHDDVEPAGHEKDEADRCHQDHGLDPVIPQVAPGEMEHVGHRASSCISTARSNRRANSWSCVTTSSAAWDSAV